MERWNGRVALVTGASVGIGAAICKELVKHGLKVVGCARRVENIQTMADELKDCSGSLHAIKCDLRNEDEILAMFEEISLIFNRIDICINNAGLSFDCPLLSGKTSEWKTMLDVNVLALSICNRESIKLMKEKNITDGQIINIGSLAGHRIPGVKVNFYSGTKFMVRALTEGLRRELKAINSEIKVASISPGIVETEFSYNHYPNDPEKVKSIYSSLVCLQGKDIADAVIYILSSPPHVNINDILVRPIEQET